MRLSIRSLAMTGGLLWASCMFVAGLINLWLPTYALTFLSMLDSIYPGYHAGQGFGSVLIGTGYAWVDGFIGGAVFAWLYNCLA